MNCSQVSFTGHAITQMFKREITESDILEVIEKGHIINEYPDDKPYPSCLIMGIIRKKVLHVVLSSDENQTCYVITAYEPDKNLWNNDFTKKKK